MESSFESALQLLPFFLQVVLEKLPREHQLSITELRMRSGRCVIAAVEGRSFFVSKKGQLFPQFPADPFLLDHGQLQEVFLCLCQYSVPMRHEQILQGFLPLEGGHRAGIGGTAVYAEGKLADIQNITSIDLRVARRDVPAVPAEVVDKIIASSSGVLIAGPPASGKTTLLRGLMSALDKWMLPFSVVDERGELAPVTAQGFAVQPPQNGDILSGYRKAEGMMQALRTLAPRLILCDEIGGEEDVAALKAAVGAGVKVIATIHANGPEQLQKRSQAQALFATGGFSLVIFLDSGGQPGRISQLWEVPERCDFLR